MPYKIAEEEVAYQKAYYEKNKEARLAYKKDYYEKNKEDRLAYKKDYYEKNKESIAAYIKAYREENKEDISAHNKDYYKKNKEARLTYQKAYREENKDAILFRRRGITLAEKNKMKDEQGNKCKICYRDFSSDVEPNVDHCHTSGKVRGLLCQQCNVGLGNFKDNPLELVKAAEYLKEQGEEAPPEGN